MQHVLETPVLNSYLFKSEVVNAVPFQAGEFEQPILQETFSSLIMASAENPPNGIVYFHYERSPFARRVRSYLAFRRIAYAECVSPESKRLAERRMADMVSRFNHVSCLVRIFKPWGSTIDGHRRWP